MVVVPTGVVVVVPSGVVVVVSTGIVVVSTGVVVVVVVSTGVVVVVTGPSHFLKTLKGRSMVTCWVTPFLVAFPIMRSTFPPSLIGTTGPTIGS
jgi:hypothetical protein